MATLSSQSAPRSSSTSPPSPPPPTSTFQPLVCIVDFHHARGPEIEQWFGLPHDDTANSNDQTTSPSPLDQSPYTSSTPSQSSRPHDEAGAPPPPNLNIADYHLIPYMALPDGAHASAEEFSYFTLVHRSPPSASSSKRTEQSIFGISCARQLDSSELKFRPPEVTRSAVQKAVVALTASPHTFGALRERLRVVTRAWFAQCDFRDVEILQRFQESLVKDAAQKDVDDEQYFGLSLREVVRTFRAQTLVLFKSLLLQPKMLFFGSHCERVCQVQFALLSLIPGLVRNLRDCADPQMNQYEETLQRAEGVRTSDRASLLAYMGIPLQIFGKGSIFGPYTPLQQLDTLTDQGTTSYVVGSTNNLLLSQKDRYCDVLVNLDDNTVSILSPHLRPQLALSVADRRWIDFLTQAVNDTWDDADPSRPTTHGYAGSETFIRMQFEEYLMAMLSATKYHTFLTRPISSAQALLSDVEGDPSADFAPSFLDAWRTTHNYSLWARSTDPQLFDISDPRHPCAGGSLTLEDVQRRLARQVAELHLDERFSQTRDVVGRRLADGRAGVTSALNRVWADFEAAREAQKRQQQSPKPEEGDGGGGGFEMVNSTGASNHPYSTSTIPSRNPAAKGDYSSAAQTSVAAAGLRASAYLSSWGVWASEKRKTGWRGNSPAGSATPTRGSLDLRTKNGGVEEGEEKE